MALGWEAADGFTGGPNLILHEALKNLQLALHKVKPKIIISLCSK